MEGIEVPFFMVVLTILGCAGSLLGASWQFHRFTMVLVDSGWLFARKHLLAAVLLFVAACLFFKSLGV